MKSKKVSIIVPVYKVEKYLEECLESLRNQTYTNLEIILCNDESPDRCPQICDEYAEKDSRFKVIHKKNGGAASARNAGLEIATGDYIGFVDSDDFVDDNYIEKLVDNLEENEVDISVCGYFDLYKDCVERIQIEKTGIYSEVEFLDRFLWDWKCGLIWNKLFKAELLRNVRFTEGNIIDDEFFTYKVVMNSKKIIVRDEPLIYYRMRMSGVMNNGKKEKQLLDRMNYLTERFELVTKEYPELYLKYLYNLTDNIITIRREANNYENVVAAIKAFQWKYCMKIMSSSLNYKIKYAYLKELLFGNKSSLLVEDKKKDKFFD